MNTPTLTNGAPMTAPHPYIATWAARWGLTRPDWSAVAAFGLPFLLYLQTLAPTIYNLDSAELTTAAATGGIMRATGYPLYLTLGKVWSLLPVGDVGYRLNLFSAFCGALTILQTEFILRRLQVGGWARFGALTLLATAPYFWSLSLIAEVYTLHVALMAGFILTLLRWGEKPSPARLAVPIFLLTISLGNHAATVLLAPAGVWYVLTKAPRVVLSPRSWLAIVSAIALAGTIFLYLPLRYAAGPAFNYAGQYNAAGVFEPVDLSTADGLLWLVTGRTFAGQMFRYALEEIGGEMAAYGVQLWRAFLAIGLGPGLLGAASLLRRDWRLGGALLLMFAANALFYINYRVVDKNTMFLPTYLVWAVWAGIGYQILLDWADGAVMAEASSWETRSKHTALVFTGRRTAGLVRSDGFSSRFHGSDEPRRREERQERKIKSSPSWRLGSENWESAATTTNIAGPAVRAALVLSAVVALIWTWGQVDLSSDFSTRQQSQAILDTVAPNAIVLGWWDTIPGVQYLQLVEGQRPDVLAINRFLISGEAMQTLIMRQAGRRPIYINNPPLSYIQTMEISQEGLLYRLEPKHMP